MFEMKLHSDPFEMIKNGSKTIEMRLNDEKRQLIKIGDIIVFTNSSTGETLKTEVVALHKFNSFEELYQNFDKISLGYKEEDVANYKDMEQYYSVDEQTKYGVLGIEIKRL